MNKSDLPDTILVKLRVVTINPDSRPYMMQTKVLEPENLFVVVRVPENHVYENNLVTEEVILTPEGLKYLTDQLESVYTKQNNNNEDDDYTEEDWKSEEFDDDDTPF